MLGRDQRRDQTQEPFEIVARRQLAKAGRPRLEQRREIGQPHTLTLGGGAEDVFAEVSGRIVGTGAQDFPTS